MAWDGRGVGGWVYGMAVLMFHWALLAEKKYIPDSYCGIDQGLVVRR